MTEPLGTQLGTTRLRRFTGAIPECERMQLADPKRFGEKEASNSELMVRSLGLSQAQFAAAVHHAFRNFTDNNALRTSVLLQAKIVLRRCGPEALLGQRVQVLQTLLLEAASRLQKSPRQQKNFRALEVTYLEPIATPEHAAELIHLPFMAYRRYLRSALNTVAVQLWQQELAQ